MVIYSYFECFVRGLEDKQRALAGSYLEPFHVTSGDSNLEFGFGDRWFV